MRIGGQAAAGLEFVAEIFELFLRESPLQKSARVDARRGVSLEIHLVAALSAAVAADEVIERHFVQRRRRGVGRNVAADVGIVAIGAYHHGHGVPAHQTFDAALDFATAGKRRLVFH